MFDRLIRVVGKENFHNLQELNILIIGLGGVGGYAFEALVRSGIGSITIVDYDFFEESNLNRQIISTQINLNSSKV